MTRAASEASLQSWERKEQVQSWRRQGCSYREMLSRVPFSLSRSTISNWCKEIELSPEQLDRLDRLYREGSYRGRLLGPKATQRRRAQETDLIRQRAKEEVASLAQNQLWLAGAMLYWAEGSKRQKVAVVNSDPALLKVAMRWLRECCKIPEQKFRVRPHLHSGQDEDQIRPFWSEILQIPLAQFTTSYFKAEGTGHRKNSLYRGTAAVAVHDRNFLHRILGWIDGIGNVIGGR